MKKHISYKYILPAISALLLTLTYPVFEVHFLAWFALIPLFYALENNNVKNRFLSGFIFGVFFFSTVCYWLIYVSVPGYIAVVIFLALWPALFSVYKLQRKGYEILLIPAVWVVLEFVRTHIFTGFPWALLGHSQYKNLNLIQISDITGAYGVSFVIVLVNFCLYLALKLKEKRSFYLSCALFAVIVLLTYGIVMMNDPATGDLPIKIAVIQGNIPQERKWDENAFDETDNTYRELTLEASYEDPDLIIWPETAATKFFSDDDKDVYNPYRSDMLIGAIYERNEDVYNSAVYISDNGEVKDVYFKIHIVPFGEYIPFEKYMPWFRRVIDKPIGDLNPGNEFTLFRLRTEKHNTYSDSLVKRIRFDRFGVLICFEDLFPELSREFVLKGASILVNITNDAWFGDTSAPYQHVQSSVFRAVENRVPVVRSANTGISCFINSRGKIYETLTIDGKASFVKGYASADVYPGVRKTFYTMYGDVFVIFCCFIIAACSAYSRKQKRREQSLELSINNRN